MPYPKDKKGKKAASEAFAICSKVKNDPSKHESCVNKVYEQKKGKGKK